MLDNDAVQGALEKYQRHMSLLSSHENSTVADYASNLMLRSTQLKDHQIGLEEFKTSVPQAQGSFGAELDLAMSSLNYMRQRVIDLFS